MIVALLLQALSLGAPAWLSSPEPGVRQRWSSVELRDAATGTTGAAVVLSSAHAAHFGITGSALLRIETTSTSTGCQPKAVRRLTNFGASAELPLPLHRSEGALLLLIPGPIAPSVRDETIEPPTDHRLELPRACPALSIRAFRRETEPDPYGKMEISLQLRRAFERGLSAEERADWLSVDHPHRWQQRVALAAALPDLLAGVPGDPGAVAALAESWAWEAIAELRSEDLELSNVEAVDHGPTQRDVEGSPRPFSRLAPDDRWEVDVSGADSFRWFVRPDVSAVHLPIRVEVAVDGRPKVIWSWVGRLDPELPDLGRQRSFTVVLPPHSRRVTLTTSLPVWGRGLLVRHRRHLEDLWTTPDRDERFDRLLSLGSADAKTRVCQALARAALGEVDPLAQLLAREPLPDAVTALLALRAAEGSSNAGQAIAFLSRAEGLLPKLEPATAAHLLALATRLRMVWLERNQDPTGAAELFVALGRAQPQLVTDEDAAWAADLDAQAVEGISTGAPLLEVLDEVLSRRPFDRDLLLARAREYQGATGWSPAPLDPPSEERVFLEAPPALITGTERSGFVRVGPEPTQLTLAKSPVPGRRPLLSLVVLRGASLGRVLHVMVDERRWTLPAFTALERLDLPLSAGEHVIRLDSPDFAGEVWVRGGRSTEALQQKRYVQVGGEGLSLPDGAHRRASIASLRVRVVAPLSQAPPQPFQLELSGRGLPRTPLWITPGPVREEPRSDLEAGVGVSDPVELVLPLPAGSGLHVSASTTAGHRVIVSVSLREHRPIAPQTNDPRSVGAGAVGASPAPDALVDLAALSGESTGLDPGARWLARAATLMELDEVALAREDLLRAWQASGLGPHQRASIRAMWRALDEVGGGASSSAPEFVAQVSVPLLLLEGHDDDPVSAGLLALLDDPAAIQRATPEELRARAGQGVAADLAIWVAARRAEQRGEVERAAALWLELASRHPEQPLLHRQAGAALLECKDPASSSRAYLELDRAARQAPRDARLYRLLRRAAGRTTLRPLRFADDSAGTRAVRVLGAEPQEPNVDLALTPPGPSQEESTPISSARGAHLGLNLNAPLTLSLRAAIIELRPSDAAAFGAEELRLAWSIDGRPPQQTPCSPTGSCNEPTVEVPAGNHSLDVQLLGGLRPVGRLWVDVARAQPASPFATERRVDYLVARRKQPIVLTVQGPALLRFELRSRADAASTGPARVTATASSTATAALEVPLELTPDPRARLDDGRPLSRPAIRTLSLPQRVAYRVEVQGGGEELLARAWVRDGQRDREVPPRGSFVVHDALSPAAGLSPPWWVQPPELRVVDGDVSPGWDSLGSVSAGARFTHQSYDASGSAVQTSNALAIAAAYRRALDPLFTTVKAAADLRVRTAGSASEWLGVEAFFMHPELRALRFNLSADLYTQPIGSERYLTGELQALVEPVFTITSGLHLVTKVGLRISAIGPPPQPSARLPEIDPDVYSLYKATHPRALYLEAGLEAEPFANVVLYANARVTSNPNLSPFDQDHISTTLLARALFGRTYAEAALRLGWYFVDADRPDSQTLSTLFFSVFQTLWSSERHRFELGASSSIHFDGRAPELSVFFSWEGSNGRGFKDHTPLEGEDYFFPQRGYGLERGAMEGSR